MWSIDKNVVNEFLSADLSLQGIGGLCDDQFYFHAAIPRWIKQDDLIHIAHLEMWVIIVAIRKWSRILKEHKFVIGCDNQAMVTIINFGRAKDKLLQTLLRQLMYELAVNNPEIMAKFILTKSNVVPDILSRWEISQSFQHQFEQIKKLHWKETLLLDVDLKLMINVQNCVNWMTDAIN